MKKITNYVVALIKSIWNKFTNLLKNKKMSSITTVQKEIDDLSKSLGNLSFLASKIDKMKIENHQQFEIDDVIKALKNGLINHNIEISKIMIKL